ncbi:MAG: hypothetical protein ACFFD1_00965 [Candidatus Thorarchaeota archaeon]
MVDRTGLDEIELKDYVRDKYTGFEGTVIGKSYFVNGCVQCLIVPKWDKKNSPEHQEASIDIQSLILVRKYKEKAIRKSLGGPGKLIKRRNY